MSRYLPASYVPADTEQLNHFQKLQLQQSRRKPFKHPLEEVHKPAACSPGNHLPVLLQLLCSGVDGQVNYEQ